VAAGRAESGSGHTDLHRASGRLRDEPKRRSTRLGGSRIRIHACHRAERGRRDRPIFAQLLGDARKLSQPTPTWRAWRARLSHELRTPIAVVRSSLENLKLAPADGARLHRARGRRPERLGHDR